MFSHFAALTLALGAASAPAASDWRFADSSANGTNISFIDVDSIRVNAGGNTEAMIFSVLAKDDEGAVAFRFHVEFQCATGKSRLMTGEMFDSSLKSDGAEDMAGEWEGNAPGTQGDTLLKFVCSKGATGDGKSLGSELPLAKGRIMLAERAAKGS